MSSSLMRRTSRVTVLSLVVALVIGVSASAALAKGSVDRFEGPFVTVVPVAFADNPAGVELMFAECDFVQRVEKPDGSSVETQLCQLTIPFFEFPGMPPERAFNAPGGSCVWFSDYFIQTGHPDPPTADSVRLTVTPSGEVSVTTKYGPNPTPGSVC